MNKHLLKMIPLLCLLLTMICGGCARKLQILTSDQRTLIIPKGQKFKALWDGELKNTVAEEDLAVMYKGYLLKLQQEANEEAWK